MIAQPIEDLRSLTRLPGAAAEAELAFAAVAAERKQPRIDPMGRGRELAQLKALVERAPEAGSALLIRGAPGAGKSALVAALVEDLRTRSIVILRASGIRAEANLPYAGLHQLLRPLLGELGALRRPHRRAIEAAFRMIASPPPDPFLISIATLDLLSVAARPGLVIIVEDAQWLDRRTSEVLSFVARRLTPDPIVLFITARDDRRSRILETGLAELCLGGLRVEAPHRPVGHVEPEPADDPTRARPIILGEATSTATGDSSMTRDLIHLADAAVDEGDAVLARRLLWAAAQEVLWESGDPDARLAARRMVERIDARPDDPWLLAVSAALGSSDPAWIIEAAGRCDRRDAAGPDLLLAGIASSIAGDVARSRALLARAAPLLPSGAEPSLTAQLLVMQSWNDIHLGRWTEAASEIAEGAQFARETEQATWSTVADVADAMIAAMRGDEPSVDLALARSGSALAARGQGWLRSRIDVVRAIGDLAAGRADAAYSRLHDRLLCSDEATWWPIDQFADAAVLAGRVEEGRALLAARGDVVDGHLGPLEAAAHDYACAVLADEGSADERQARAIDDLADWPIHQARLQLHRGRWLRRHRRVADSRAPLRAARDLFDAVGAAPLAEQARRELRASGERIRRRDITEWDQLSPQESEIATLAAEGMSNREIGEQLFLSHRTVGAHLYRIFPKLGVTSRGQLHTVLPAIEARAGGSHPATPQLSAYTEV